MQDDPFARAVERAQAAEKAEADKKRRRRQDQVGSGTRTAFRTHLTVYLAVNLLLFAIWITTTPGGYPWFLWVLLGWGIGLAAHYSATADFMRGRDRRPEPAPQYAPTPPVAPVAPAPVPAAAAPPAPAAAPTPSTTDELHRLAELHRSGDLDDEEYRAAKKKLLS